MPLPPSYLISFYLILSHFISFYLILSEVEMTVCKSLHFFFILLVAGVLLLVAVLVHPASADACTDVCTCYVRKVFMHIHAKHC